MDTISAAATAEKMDASAAFAPSVWGDFFVTYVPPPTQSSEDWIREKAEELKRRVHRKFFIEDGEAIGVAKSVALVDTLERLGLGSHFRGDIAAVISRIHLAGDEYVGYDDLHVAATRFRLLRQHGLWVSTGVFDKFRDDTGSFSASLSSDPRALLSLYHAAHMAVPGDAALDDAITFARLHLESMKGELGSPMAQQIARALDRPLTRFSRLLETMHYVSEYAQEEAHDDTLLELARLNSNLMRSLHLRELKALSLWWRELYDTVNLTYTRDRMVEIYSWSCGMLPEEEHSRARLFFAKIFGIASFLDDTFDVHATIDECHSLNQAMQRLDESAVSILPEYLHTLYLKTLSNFKEFGDLLEPHEKYRMSYAKKAFQLQSEYYMQEAEWTNNKYRPTFEEHIGISGMSSGIPMFVVMALMGYDSKVATQEVFEWVSVPVPDVVRAGALIVRFLNDISSYKLGKNKKDVVSTVECYMLEKGCTGEEAVAAIAAMTEHMWRVMNRTCMEIDRALLPAAQLVVNMAGMSEVIYLHGRDGFTFGSHAKDLVKALFLDPIPL
ncbi:terpene synthase [Hordeum vulgare]|nr:terpene synthase [Hordeum vulgare]